MLEQSANHGSVGPAPSVTGSLLSSFLKKMHNKKAAGPDKISTKTVKLLTGLSHYSPDKATYTCYSFSHFLLK